MQVGTLEYLAPEVLLNQPYSFPADIYAWAVTVNEVATGTLPFSDCTKDNPAAHTVLNFGYGRCSVLPFSCNHSYVCRWIQKDVTATLYPSLIGSHQSGPAGSNVSSERSGP